MNQLQDPQSHMKEFHHIEEKVLVRTSKEASIDCMAVLAIVYVYVTVCI